MAVYVDDMRARYRRMIMCHMIATSDEDLHKMAALIGMARRWHQNPGTAQSHYDICLSMRAKAIQLGAIEITWRQTGAMTRHRQVHGTLIDPLKAEAWLAEHYRARKLLRENQAAA